MNRITRLISIILLMSVFAGIGRPAFAQQKEKSDSLVWLLEALSAQMYEIGDTTYRKVVGPARFLHNDTYLICDTALWNVDRNVIDAMGNVSIVQDGTVLTSDKMVYLVDYNLAKFRGSVVQLEDKDHNMLRTGNLDYNTKDSVAIFRQGASMRDKDGQIVESINGTYDSKISTFVFRDDVNMFTDSIFVKTTELVYESDKNLATFGRATDAWKDDNMLSAEAGWYDRARELFLFRKNVHVMTDTQEAWGDSLYFHRNDMIVTLSGNAQVTDTSRNVSAVAGRMHYVDSISRMTLTRRPAVIAEVAEAEGVDTVYFGADTLIYYTLPMCDIDSAYLADSKKRLADMDTDPVSTYRAKSRAEAAQKNSQKDGKSGQGGKNGQGGARPNQGASAAGPANPGGTQGKSGGNPAMKRTTKGKKLSYADSATAAVMAVMDSVAAVKSVPQTPVVPFPALGDSLASSPLRDSLDKQALPSAVDSLAPTDSLASADSLAATDSLSAADSIPAAPAKDTTKMGFLKALRNVKIYRKTMQIICDSLEYSDVDSLARLFKEPIIWNEIRHQYAADSISAIIRNGSMEKASLMSNAFIHVQEDSIHYDQIKGAEMVAYFDPSGELTRFDALGGASALFYIEEQETLATVNKKESKMLSAIFNNGDISKIYYFDTASSDAYPLVQMTKDDQTLKGFNWQPKRRPASHNDVTPLRLRPIERARYEKRPRAAFKQTEKYFPGYMGDIYRQIQVRDSIQAVRARERAERQRLEKMASDSLALKDSLALTDSLGLRDSLALADSLAIRDSLALSDSLASADSLALRDSIAINDSLAVSDSVAIKDSLQTEKVLSKEEIRKQREAERQKKREERLAAKQRKKEAKEKKWEEMDRRDAEKLKAKEEKKAAKLRKRQMEALKEALRQNAIDESKLEKFKEEYRNKELRRRAKKSDSSKRSQQKD